MIDYQAKRSRPYTFQELFKLRADDPVLVVTQGPDRHPQRSLSFAEDSDRWITSAQPADDLIGRERDSAFGSIRSRRGVNGWQFRAHRAARLCRGSVRAVSIISAVRDSQVRHSAA